MSSTPSEISCQEVSRRRREGDDFLLLDCREAEEFETVSKGPLKGDIQFLVGGNSVVKDGVHVAVPEIGGEPLKKGDTGPD